MISLLSHLSHIQIGAPDVDASVDWYVDQFGLTVHDRRGEDVYLRSWGDYYNYSLVVSPAAQPSMVVAAWRTTSAEALQEIARRVNDRGIAGEWAEAGVGHGRSFTFTGPWGHTLRFFWEVEHYQAPAHRRSQYPDRPARRTGNGVAPRQIDHITIAASDVRGFCEWHRDLLGFRITAYTVPDEMPDLCVFGVLTTNEKSHDLGVVLDASPVPGRINHLAYWVDTREELLRGADLLLENGTAIEYGPSIHGIGEQSFLYFREPSGLRIELNTGGYRNYVPDWQPYDWRPSEGSNNFYKNGAFPFSMTESFPPVDGAVSATEEGVHPDTVGLIHATFDKQG
jgi:catechol 2,3-dioxygenase